MFTETVQPMRYEVQLQRKLQHRPLAIGKESQPDSKLVLDEDGRGVTIRIDLKIDLFRKESPSLPYMSAFSAYIMSPIVGISTIVNGAFPY
ncbi:hypothetical protein TNCV_4171381 [Trichonephila clavipes]|nr:hypothetical protein TNCV_4171381 [Trichonephila clavipes]